VQKVGPGASALVPSPTACCASRSRPRQLRPGSVRAR
jgi:hypothetical protein